MVYGLAWKTDETGPPPLLLGAMHASSYFSSLSPHIARIYCLAVASPPSPIAPVSTKRNRLSVSSFFLFLLSLSPPVETGERDRFPPPAKENFDMLTWHWTHRVALSLSLSLRRTAVKKGDKTVLGISGE